MTTTANPAPGDTQDENRAAVREVGARVRRLRKERSLSLRELAERAGMSLSMLSMIERGVAGASIGTLVGISSGLGVHMSELFERKRGRDDDVVSRRSEQTVALTPNGALRRVLREESTLGLEVAWNEYESGGASGLEPSRHAGREFGIVLRGELVVVLDGARHRLGRGDVIGYDSTRPHRILNDTSETAHAIWVNIRA